MMTQQLFPIARSRSRPLVSTSTRPLLRPSLFLFLLLTGITTVDAGVSDDTESNRMAQWSVGHFGVELSPTPESLMDPPHGQDNMMSVMQSALFAYLESELGGLFEYVLVAGIYSSIWKEGGVTPPLTRLRLLTQQQDGTYPPTTVVYFNGAVIGLEDDPAIENIDIMSLFQEAINTHLVPYMASGSVYSEITHARFIDLAVEGIGKIADDTLTQGPTEQIIEVANSDEDNDESGTTVDAVQDGSNMAIAEDKNSNRTSQIIAGSVIGALMICVAVSFWVSKKGRHLRHSQLVDVETEGSRRRRRPGGWKRDVDTVSEEEDVDEDDDAITAETRDHSVMAQYARATAASPCVDAMSVTSEWTLNTTDESKNSSAPHGKRLTADMMADSETFDRDRVMTLQKDMLQSQWSSAGAAAGSGATRGGNLIHPSSWPPRPPSRLSATSTRDLRRDRESLTFEQAYEEHQGEEVSFEPTPRSQMRWSSSGRHHQP